MSPLNRAGRRALPTDERSRKFRLGLCLYVGVALVLMVLAVKPQLTTMLSSGRTMTAEFGNAYKLRAYDSSVKVAGIEVGRVTKIDKTDRNTVIVTMKVDDATFDQVGSNPTASIEPRTLLGGRYAIELHHSGEGSFSGNIPLARTTAPTELDSVLEALPATARESVQGLAGKGSSALAASDKSLTKLLRDAPSVLDPAADVVGAARGTRPGQDLPALVGNLSAAADVLTAHDGRLDSIAVNLDRTARVLARHRQSLVRTLDTLPQTVRAARAGITGLDASIVELRTTARDLRPSAPKVDDLVAALDPLLVKAKPLLADLRPTLADARPAVRALGPVATRATSIVDTLHGPVLDRVNGPVMKFLLNPWVGAGPYAESAKGYQKDHKFYEELAYMATNVDRASMSQDQRGSTLGFQVGAGLDVIGGLPFSIDNLVKLALKQAGLYHEIGADK